MPLNSLLFSSHPETANPVLQALRELDLVVEHSVEIFAAIREITSRSFDLIVADLDDGPEADFLLKTTRELRINKDAFVLALGSEARSRPGPHNRADLVLNKPLVPEQTKYSLLGCDRFLITYMRAGVEDATPARVGAEPSISNVVAPVNLLPSVHRQ